MPMTADGLQLLCFFQHEVRIPLLPGVPCGKDEIASGFQHHYDRERERSVRNEIKGKNLTSPLDLQVGKHVVIQDELRKGKPYSIPGKVVEVRENGCSAFVLCPGKRKHMLRNRRKISLQVFSDNDEEEEDDDDDVVSDEFDGDEALDEIADLGSGESVGMLTSKAGCLGATHLMAFQDSAVFQLVWSGLY